MRHLILLAAAATLLGCKAEVTADTAADTAAIEQQLKGIEGQWLADYNARDAKRLAEHYAPDGAIANPGAPLASDARARAEAIGIMAADQNLRVDFASDRIQIAKSGELAYTRGHYTIRTTDPTTRQPRSDSGNYLTVWQKQADDSWKAVEDFITPGPPAAAG